MNRLWQRVIRNALEDAYADGFISGYSAATNPPSGWAVADMDTLTLLQRLALKVESGEVSVRDLLSVLNRETD